MSSIMSFSYDSRPIQTVVHQIKNNNKQNGIDLNPKYQRGYIWPNEFKDKLIYSIIKNYPIGNISIRVLNSPNEKKSIEEVVDGQQRLKTIYNFISGAYNVQGEYAKKIIESIIEYLGNDNDEKYERLKNRYEKAKGKISLKFEQFPNIIKDKINSYNVSITKIMNSTEAEITEYFRYLQNQEILRAGEIINSMPDTNLEKYILEIEDKESFLKKTGFSNNRRQFDRIFYSILGLLDGEIGFGTLDRAVLNYVASSDDLSTKTAEKCKIMIKQINYIEKTLPFNFINSNARLMKFLLLLTSLSLVDFIDDTEAKIGTLAKINDKLSAFSSAKADSITTAFSGYEKDVIEEYRLIALISKGGHSFNRVENRMKILAYYINNKDNKIKPSGIKPI